MAFDVEGAKKAGYSESEIAEHLSTESKFDFLSARKAGYSDAEIIGHLTKAQPQAEPASEGMPQQRRFDFASATPEERKAYSRQQLETGPKWVGQIPLVAASLAGPGLASLGLRALALRAPSAAGFLTPAATAIETGGLAKTGLTSKAADIGARVAGGATAGAIGTVPLSQDTGEILTGAGLGAVLPGIGAGINKLFSPSMTQEAASQAKRAIDKYGIPLGIGDVSPNRMVKATQSILADLPITGGMSKKAAEAKQEALNKAVGQVFGSPSKKLTPEILDSAKARMGNEFDRIWNNNNLVVSNELTNTLDNLQEVAKKLPSNEGGSLSREIDDFVSRIARDNSGNMIVPGDVANKFQTYLRRRADSSPGLKNELGDMRQAIIKSFNDGVSQLDAKALTLNREQYKAFKTIEPLLRSSELGIAGREVGDVPAALLPGAVGKSYKSNLQNVPLADLAGISSRFMINRTPQTGGSAKAALQNIGVGVGITAAPKAALVGIPTAIGMQSLLQNPVLARRFISNQLSPNVTPQILNQLLYRSIPTVSTQD